MAGLLAIFISADAKWLLLHTITGLTGICIAQDFTAWLKWPTLRLLSSLVLHEVTAAYQDRSHTTNAVKRRASLNKQPSVPVSGGSQYFSPGDRFLCGTDHEQRWISHLKKQRAFGVAKEKISKAFRRLSEQLTASESFLKDIESAKQQNVAPLGMKVQGIKDVLASAPMKVVFFGRTSISSSTK